MIPVLLLTFWLGARGLNADALWGDEYHSIQDSGGPMTGPLDPAQVWNKVATENPWHAPGYFILLNGWGRLTGWTPPGLRALSLLAGLLAVAWTYRAARDFLSPRVGLYAAAILGTSAFFVNFLHELRMYALVAALTIFTIWSYQRVVSRRQPSKLDWLGLFVGALGLLYIHYFAALLLVAIGLYHLLFVPKNRRWLNVIVVFALAGLLFLPWAGALVAGLHKASSFDWLNDRALDAGEILGETFTLFANGALPLLLVVALLAFVASLPRRVIRKAMPFWFFAVALLALIIGVNAVVSVILASRIRYMISLWPLLALLAGVGIAAVAALGLPRARMLSLGLLAVWIGIGVWNSTHVGVTAILDGAAYTFPLQASRVVAQQQGARGDAVVNVLGDTLGAWMYEGIQNYYYDDLGITTELFDRHGKVEMRRQIERLLPALQSHRRVWLAYVPDPPPSSLPNAQTMLTGASYALCGVSDREPAVRMELYAQTPVCCGPDFSDAAPLARFGAGVALTGIDLPATAHTGDSLPVIAGWQGGDSLPVDSYSVALHLVDSAGHLIAQADDGLSGERFSCPRTALRLDNVPPGRYTLQTGVYNWHDGTRLAGTLGTNAPSADLLPIGEVTVS